MTGCFATDLGEDSGTSSTLADQYNWFTFDQNWEEWKEERVDLDLHWHDSV